MVESSDQSGADPSTSGIVPRPIQVLKELPIEYQWEFTRRHPYYLLFWEQAHRYLQDPNDDTAEGLLGKAAVFMLTLIGVTGDPPPPGAGLEEVEAADLSKAWRDGAIAPITFRGLTGVMLKELPPESRLAIGKLLVNSASIDDGDAPHDYHLFSEFLNFQDPSLDKMPVAPIVGVDVNAPLRTIVAAVEQWVRELKAQQGIPEHRRHYEKLPDYLRVWDLREGWSGDRYDSSREKTLREIATELSESVPTVRNRYRSAFRYIAGQDYSPELWVRLFGVMKTSEVIEPEARPRLTTRRPWRSPVRRDVPETVLAPQEQEGHRGSFLVNNVITPDMLEMTDLLMDIQTLIDRGLSNEEIADELELPRETVDDLVEYFRQRQQEGI